MKIALEEPWFPSSNLKHNCFAFVTTFNSVRKAATKDKTTFLPLFSILNYFGNQFVLIYKTYPQKKKIQIKQYTKIFIG